MSTKRRRRAVVIIILLGIVGVALGITPKSWRNSAADWLHISSIDQGVVAANNRTAFELFGKLAEGSNDNIFFSPFSVSLALSQAYAGAQGRTALEMQQALHFDFSVTRLHKTMGALLDELESTDGNGGQELAVASALWVDKGCGLLPEFAAISRDYYHAPPTAAAFHEAPEAQCQAINDWIAEKTHGKIGDLLEKGAVPEDTRLVLTNAVYFKGAWEKHFSAASTRPAQFTTAENQKVPVQMMGQTNKFYYAELEQVQILELRYAGDASSMVIFLPRQTNGLAILQENLRARGLGPWIGELKKQKVLVFIPRFALTATYRLDQALQALGMRDAFSRVDADFSNMSNTPPLYIDAILHKAHVEVEEKGTEAVAVTAVGMAKKAEAKNPAKEPPVFRADHPFIFVIRDLRTESILFLGRVMNPQAP